jgi:transcriptional regulator with XRE-family HTH domain
MDRTFAVRLTDLRKDTGLSQKDAAAALGVSQALLSHYEKGIRECGLSFITRASKYYGVTCDYLLGTSSCKRGLGEGVFASGDMPEDNELSSLTIFRISSLMRERLLKLEKTPVYGDRFITFYALSMYRLLVTAINAGDLPRSWLGENPMNDNPVYLECLTGLSNILLDIEKSQPKEGNAETTPLCIKTLVDEMEKFIDSQVKPLCQC